MNISKDRLGHFLLAATFYSSLLWLFAGYTFGTSNHGVEIQPILTLIDKQLYPHDFAVHTFLEPGPRYVYNNSVAFLASSLGVGVDLIYIFIKISTHISFFLALIFISKIIMGKLRICVVNAELQTLLFVPFLVFFIVMTPYSWGSLIIDGDVRAATVAMAIAIWALYFALCDRWIYAFAFAGFAIFFQFLVGLHAGLVLFPALLIFMLRGGSVKIVAASILAWIVPAIVVYLMMQSNSGDELHQSFNFVEIFGYLRMPHHWRPSTGHSDQWIADAMLLCSSFISLSILLVSRHTSLTNISVTLSGILIAASMGVALNYIFIELIPMEIIGKLQFQRIMPFAHIAAALSILTAICILYDDAALISKKSSLLLIVLVLVLAAPSVFNGLESKVGLGLRLDIGLTSILGIATLLFSFVNIKYKAILVSVAVLLIVLANTPLTKLSPYGSDTLNARYRAFDSVHWDGEGISNWLKGNTPIDTLVVIPPDWSIMADSLAFESRRSVYFSFKNIPFTNSGVSEWASRAETLLGVPLSVDISGSALRAIWNERPSDDIIDVIQQAGACYLVDRLKNRRDIDLDMVFSSKIEPSNEVWAIWKSDTCV